MSLTNFIDDKLNGNNCTKVDIKKLAVLITQEQRYFNLLASGRLNEPDVGVIGDWSFDETKVMYEIINLKNDCDNLLSKSPTEAQSKLVYSKLKKMEPGCIARINIGPSEYLMAALQEADST